jgi:hypothetical protein
MHHFIAASQVIRNSLNDDDDNITVKTPTKAGT